METNHLTFVFLTFLSLKSEEMLCHFPSPSQGHWVFNQTPESFLIFEERLLYEFAMLFFNVGSQADPGCSSRTWSK